MAIGSVISRLMQRGMRQPSAFGQAMPSIDQIQPLKQQQLGQTGGATGSSPGNYLNQIQPLKQQQLGQTGGATGPGNYLNQIQPLKQQQLGGMQQPQQQFGGLTPEMSQLLSRLLQRGGF